MQELDKFIKEHGLVSFDIMGRYETAVNIPCDERYASWFGDYNMFEPSFAAPMDYSKLSTRYNEALRFFGQ